MIGCVIVMRHHPVTNLGHRLVHFSLSFHIFWRTFIAWWESCLSVRMFYIWKYWTNL